MSGRVIDDLNVPVSGAMITQWDTANRATSDSAGAFDLTAMVSAQDHSFWVTVEKNGFETSELNRSVDTAANTTLRLHAIRTISPGDSVQDLVRPDGSACGYHWGYVCRRLRIVAAATGTVRLELLSDASGIIGIGTGTITGFPQVLERRITLPVKAGTEVPVDIQADWQIPAAASFTLQTSFIP